MATPTTGVEGSFRVPNSVIQGLTTTTTTDLNRLSAFQMATLFGLLSAVSPKAPLKEVRMRLSEILRIIEVSKRVAHAVTREWETADGEQRRRRYCSERFSPKHLQQIHGALLALYNQSVLIRRRNKKTQRRLDDRHVHLLDMFGYTYHRDGQAIDLDDLPAGSQKVNVGSMERPVWRILRQTDGGDCFDHPSGIIFRLNTELANELENNRRGTLGFTIIARKIFGLFKRYMNNPAIIRLIILILRQTGQDFSRKLRPALAGLGFDPTHPARAVEQLEQGLSQLRDLGIVVGFNVEFDDDALAVVRNIDWHRSELPSS